MKRKIKLILKAVREYKIYAILTPIFMLFEAGMECFIPWMMTNLVGDMRTANGLGDIWVDIVILLGMGVVSILAGILGGILLRR